MGQWGGTVGAEHTLCATTAEDNAIEAHRLAMASMRCGLRRGSSPSPNIACCSCGRATAATLLLTGCDVNSASLCSAPRGASHRSPMDPPADGPAPPAPSAPQEATTPAAGEAAPTAHDASPPSVGQGRAMCATAGCNRPSDRYHKHLRGRLCVRSCSYHYRIEPSSELECEHCAEATPLVTVETAGGGVRLCARCEPLKQVRALLPTSVHLRVSLCTIVSHGAMLSLTPYLAVHHGAGASQTA